MREVCAMQIITGFDYTVDTSKSVDAATAEVERLAAEKGFKVLATHDVTATLAGKGFNRPPMKIVEVCNAKYAYEVLRVDPKISLMLPCPISVYEDNGKTYISTMLPTIMADMFPGEVVASVAREVEAVVKDIINEAK